jgi:hypothetical protein
MKIKPIASNMTELTVPNAVVLFSYETPVACESNGTYYRTEYKWSQTTTRHINKWLDGVNAETKPQEFFNNLVGA